MKKFWTAIALALLLSCAPAYKLIDGRDKVIDFKNKEDCTAYFSTKYHLDKSHIYFPKQSPNSVISYLAKEKVSYFYGITLNDSLKINDPFLNENNSCFGRISKIINSSETNYNTNPTSLPKFDYSNINGETIDFNKGKSVIFIISTKLGNSINRDIKKLSEEVASINDPGINYYLISVDNIGATKTP